MSDQTKLFLLRVHNVDAFMCGHVRCTMYVSLCVRVYASVHFQCFSAQTTLRVMAWCSTFGESNLYCATSFLLLSLLISLVAQLTSYFYFRIFPIQIWFGISIWNHILAKNPAFPVHFEQYLTPVHRFISHSPPPPPLQPPSSSSSSPSPSTYSLRILCKHHKMHIAKPKFIYLQMQVFVSSCVCDVGIFAVLKASSFVCSIREQHSHICICISVHIHNIACSMCTFECTVLLFFACIGLHTTSTVCVK